MKKTFLFIFSFLFFTSLVFGAVFITELADPNNNAGVRYIELYNNGTSAVDFTEGSGWRIDKYTNASATVSQTLNLTGLIPVSGFYIIATGTDDGDFFTVYGVTADQFDGSNDFVAGSNGDDNLELYDGTTTLIDQFGVPGEDGTNTNHEFEDGRAERVATVVSGNATWGVNEWNIDNDGTLFPGAGPQNAPGDFDPGAWIGTGANILPTITNIVQTPTSGITSSTTVSVSADVTDADGTISLVEIHWGIASGSLGTTIPMSNGSSGDTYTTTSDIPAQSDGTTVYYEIYAEDDVPESRTSMEYNYYVSDAGGPVLGDLIITEVCGDGVDSGSDNGFMEIFNTTSNTLSLANIQVRYYNTNPGNPTQTVDLSGIITPGGYIIITQNETNFNTTYAPLTADFSGSAFYFNGGDDGVDIYDTTSDAEILDSFNDNGVGHTPWTWNDNNVFERTSTGDGATLTNWTENATGSGTPGADNDNPLPVTLTEFSTAIIMSEFVQISWTTQSESSINVWNLYRKTDDSAGQILINNQPGTNTSQPFTYIFEDHEVEEDVTYYYYLVVTEYDGSSNMWGPINAILEGSVIQELPITSMLQINYPNPFNPSTTIKCDIKEGEEGEFTIYNSRGQVIERQLLNAGEHIIEWDGTPYGSGVYLYKLESESYTKTRKMIMIK